MSINTVDINCDLGESFGCWKLGDSEDILLMDMISSANVATGFHAGDPNLMDYTVRLAGERGIGIGAHPGYRDLHGFGRRKMIANDEEIMNDIIYQVGSLREFTRRHGFSLQHVKPHGALYMEMASNAEMSRLFIDYMQRVAPEAFIFCMSISETYRIAREMGQPVVREFYADRDYSNTGSIVFTRNVGKLDPQAIADKVVRACLEGKVRTVEGDDIDVEFDSICFHSDTPGCFEIATAMSDGFQANQIQVRPVSQALANQQRT